jgi:hypothetical protein
MVKQWSGGQMVKQWSGGQMVKQWSGSQMVKQRSGGQMVKQRSRARHLGTCSSAAPDCRAQHPPDERAAHAFTHSPPYSCNPSPRSSTTCPPAPARPAPHHHSVGGGGGAEGVDGRAGSLRPNQWSNSGQMVKWSNSGQGRGAPSLPCSPVPLPLRKSRPPIFLPQGQHLPPSHLMPPPPHPPPIPPTCGIILLSADTDHRPRVLSVRACKYWKRFRCTPGLFDQAICAAVGPCLCRCVRALEATESICGAAARAALTNVN